MVYSQVPQVSTDRCNALLLIIKEQWCVFSSGRELFVKWKGKRPCMCFFGEKASSLSSSRQARWRWWRWRWRRECLHQLRQPDLSQFPVRNAAGVNHMRCPAWLPHLSFMLNWRHCQRGCDKRQAGAGWDWVMKACSVVYSERRASTRASRL